MESYRAILNIFSVLIVNSKADTCGCRLAISSDGESDGVCDQLINSQTFACRLSCKEYFETGAKDNTEIHATVICGDCQYCIIAASFTSDKKQRSRINIAQDKRFECNISRSANHTTKSEETQFSGMSIASCSDRAFMRCRTSALNYCAAEQVLHSATKYPSTRSTKIATLASPNGDHTNQGVPPFLVIGFIISLVILGTILASIFYQANMHSSSKKSRDPRLSGYTEETDMPLNPLAKRETLLLVPRTDAARIDSTHRTAVTEINTIEPYKTYKT